MEPLAVGSFCQTFSMPPGCPRVQRKTLTLIKHLAKNFHHHRRDALMTGCARNRHWHLLTSAFNSDGYCHHSRVVWGRRCLTFRFSTCRQPLQPAFRSVYQLVNCFSHFVGEILWWLWLWRLRFINLFIIEWIWMNEWMNNMKLVLWNISMNDAINAADTIAC